MTEDDNGWTHVSKSRKSRAPNAINGQNPPSRDLTLESLKHEFAAKSETWKQSACRKSLLTLLGRIRPETSWGIHRAVCIGSGSLSRENLECKRRSFWQMVVFLDIAKTLEAKELYAQEPAYTELDKEFLKALAVNTLDAFAASEGKGGKRAALGPANDALGQDAFLFEPFMDMNPSMVLEILEKDVGLYIGSSMRGLVEKGTRASATAYSRQTLQSKHVVEAGQTAKTFCEARGYYCFPKFEVDPNIFDGMGIYWKEVKGEDDD